MEHRNKEIIWYFLINRLNEKKYHMTLGHKTFDKGSVQIQVKNEE